MAGGRPCPATSTLYSGAQPRRHKTVFKLSFQAADANLSILTKGMARITRRKIDSAILVVSVAKYTVKRRGPPSQGWRTFLRNHAAMDLFVVPTISFDLLYAFVI